MFFPINKKMTSQRRLDQRGSALVVALFVIIVMSLLGTALVNMQSTSSEAIAQEVLGTRALAAARSGMQRQLSILFPIGARAAQCAAFYEQDFTVEGLQNCSVEVTCEQYARNDDIGYYRLTSTGTCGSGTVESDSASTVVSSRTIQVEARDLL